MAGTKEEAKSEEKKSGEKGETSTRSKRASIFGSLFQKAAHNEKDKETPAKSEETSAVSNTAPQLDNPVAPAASEPIKPESVTQTSTSENKDKDAGASKEGGKSASSPLSMGKSFLNKLKDVS